ncbi:Rhodanese domain-containing protein [Salinisphaera shabanensis T35B1]|uniref:rhodanese-like domain-containing protein n=1 Tax=Salinisphaera shabanensis TaxID=180542 RepID=UPI003340B406
MPIETSAQTLVARAEERVTTLSPADVAARRGDANVLLVDLRDIRERKREGYIPGSMHVPRGMLEFWIDPDSPYHKPALLDADSLILYCNKGWRSALATATLLDMGLTEVAHMEGGFTRWAEQTREVAHDD